MSEIFKHLIMCIFNDSIDACVTHLGLKAGAALLGSSYSIPFSAAVITKATAYLLALSLSISLLWIPPIGNLINKGDLIPKNQST